MKYECLVSSVHRGIISWFLVGLNKEIMHVKVSVKVPGTLWKLRKKMLVYFSLHPRVV